MSSSGINGEGELRGQLANPGSPGKMAVEIECVCCIAERVMKKLLHTGNCLKVYYFALYNDYYFSKW